VYYVSGNIVITAVTTFEENSIDALECKLTTTLLSSYGTAWTCVTKSFTAHKSTWLKLSM